MAKLNCMNQLVAIFAIGIALAATPARAALYEAEIPSELYGNLNQNDVPVFGGWACGPTAATNGFAYLQNVYPDCYGNSLIPPQEQDLDQDGVVDFYDDMIATVQTLGTNEYMRTAAMGYTAVELHFWGQHRFIEDRAAGVTVYEAQNAWPWYFHDRPDWCAPVDPTWDFLYESLLGGADVSFGVAWTGGGHYLSLNGFYWDDANANGIIEQEEDATISFVDPCTGLPGSTPIWHGSAGHIRTNYVGDSRIVAAFAVAPIPEPATIVLMALGVLVIRRRCR